MKRPNIVLICTDQQRSDSLACCGNSVVSTPNLDVLASEGTRLTRHRVTNQICQPSRATLFTGMQPRRHRVAHNGVALDPSVVTFPELLTRAGYATHGVGKFHLQPILAPASYRMPDSNAFWTLPDSEDWRGPFYGFESVDILIGEADWCTEGGHYARWLHREHPEAVALVSPDAGLDATPEDLSETWKCAIPFELHYDSWIADRAVDFIRAADSPYFLYVSFPDPHHPFSPPRPYCDLYDPADVALPRPRPGELDAMPSYITAIARVQDQRKAPEQGSMLLTALFSESSLRRAIAHTYGMVTMIDDCVGRIFSALKDCGDWDNTIVLFTSDHGELLGDHGLLRKGPPPYRQLCEVTFLARGPGIKAAHQSDRLTSHLDVLPTVLDLAGVAAPSCDGESFAGTLSEGDGGSREYLFSEYHPRNMPITYNRSVLTDRFRLTVYDRASGWGELFDLDDDPFEQCNRFHDPALRPEVDALTALMDESFPSMPDLGVRSLGRW